MKPVTTPAYPFYTKIVGRDGNIDSVVAYITPRHKVQLDLFSGHEHADIDEAFGNRQVFPPKWEATEEHPWKEVLSTKKEFAAGLKRFNDRIKEALNGQDYRHDTTELSWKVKKAYSI